MSSKPNALQGGSRLNVIQEDNESQFRSLKGQSNTTLINNRENDGSEKKRSLDRSNSPRGSSCKSQPQFGYFAALGKFNELSSKRNQPPVINEKAETNRK